MAKPWMISDQWELRVRIGMMEDPMDENKDDNIGSMMEIERKKK